MRIMEDRGIKSEAVSISIERNDKVHLLASYKELVLLLKIFNTAFREIAFSHVFDGYRSHITEDRCE